MGNSKYIIILLALAFIACEDILEVPDISGEEVGLLAPTENAVVAPGEINFNWTTVTEAEAYRVQIAADGFEAATQIVLDSLVIVDSTFIGARVNQTLLEGSYEWRVKAQNSDYETPYSTATFSVVTE